MQDKTEDRNESNNLKEKLKSLPNRPGVYIFHGEDNEVLYVGKAKSL